MDRRRCNQQTFHSLCFVTFFGIILFSTPCYATIIVHPTSPAVPQLPFGCSVQIILPSSTLEDETSISNIVIQLDKFHIVFNPLVISLHGRNTYLDLKSPAPGNSANLIERSISNSNHLLKFGLCIAFVTISSSYNDLSSLLSIIQASSKLTNGHQNIWYIGFLISLNQTTSEVFQVKVQENFHGASFRIKHPKVVLILQPAADDNDNKWTVICYLCPVKLYPTTWIHGHPKNLQEIETLYMSLNSQGYGTKIESPEGWRNLDHEADGFVHWNQSGVIGIFRGIIHKQFNFSITPPPVALPFISTPRLMICMRCNISSIRIRTQTLTEGGGGHLLILAQNKYHHLYCQSRANLQSSPLTFFLRPFDTSIWICILICSLMAGLKIKSIWGCLDVIWTLIGIPKQLRWSLSISFLFFLLLLPQQLYIAYFTSDVLAPLKIKRIQSNQELFTTAGFKVIDTTELNLRQQYQEIDLSKFGLEFSNSLFMIENETKSCGSSVAWWDCIAHWPDVGTRQIEPKFASHDIEKIRQSNPKLYCNIVIEPILESHWITIQLQGHLQDLVADYVSRLIGGGFHEFWDSIYLAGIELAGHSSSVETFTYAKLSFNTALTSVFKLYGILACGATMGFICEIITKAVSRISWRMVCEFGKMIWKILKCFLTLVFEKLMNLINNCLNFINSLCNP